MVLLLILWSRGAFPRPFAGLAPAVGVTPHQLYRTRRQLLAARVILRRGRRQRYPVYRLNPDVAAWGLCPQAAMFWERHPSIARAWRQEFPLLPRLPYAPPQCQVTQIQPGHWRFQRLPLRLRRLALREISRQARHLWDQGFYRRFGQRYQWNRRDHAIRGRLIRLLPHLGCWRAILDRALATATPPRFGDLNIRTIHDWIRAATRPRLHGGP